MRGVPKSIDDAFYAGTRRSREVPLVINDSVEITSGPYSGRGGAVISIDSLEPSMTLFVELGDTGEDVVVPIGDLRRDESNG